MVFRHPANHVCIELHMDDFYVAGPNQHGQAFVARICEVCELKVQGPFRKGDTWSHLRRVRLWVDRGIVVKIDPRHVQNLQKLLDLVGCVTKATPITKDMTKDPPENEVPLGPIDVRLFRRCTGIALYIGLDRPDCQFAISECSRMMSAPTARGLNILRRMTRYLAGTKDHGILIAPGERGDKYDVESHTDADWAANVRDRRSISCAHLFVKGCLLANFVRRQGRASTTALAWGLARPSFSAACWTS